MKIKCSECGKVMNRRDWEAHKCPMVLKPRRGETFEQFSARCEARKNKKTV